MIIFIILFCSFHGRGTSTSELKAYIDQTESVYGASALHFAIQMGHNHVASLLLDKGAAFDTRLRYKVKEVDRDTSSGDTALHLACGKGYTAYVHAYKLVLI